MKEIPIQPAAQEDVAGIAALVNGFAAMNVMLPRTEESILQTLPDWLVALDHGAAGGGGTSAASRLLGCGSLVSLTEQLVEIRSLAVATQGQGRGIGRRIVLELVQMAAARGYAQICALTLEEGFFERLGFEVVDRWSISPKLWQDCIYCPKFHRCDEVAVALNLTDEPPKEIYASRSGASPLLRWQSWQPLKLAYRRSGRDRAAHAATDRQPIQLSTTSSHKEDPK